MRQHLKMKMPMRILSCFLTALLLVGAPLRSQAGKSYSSGGGGHSYSSHSSSSHSSGSSSHSSGGHSSSGYSSHTSSSGSTRSSSSGSTHSSTTTRSSSSDGSSSKTFSSGGGKSYSSSSTSSDNNRHGYSSSKSYASSPDHKFSPAPSSSGSSTPAKPAKSTVRDSSGDSMTFDTAAAQARKQEASKRSYTQYKQSQTPKTDVEPVRTADSYRAKPPPVPSSGNWSYGRTVYVPSPQVVVTRRVRVYNVFNPYWSRPWVVYNDPYGSYFWWWLLDQSLDDRAWWAYHHRYDMDPARYEALMATDQQLENRVTQLEAQQTARDPAYTPASLDRDLMYSDDYVSRSYSNRPTTAGVVAFWVIAVPTALGVSIFFIWLIWFKRWQTST